MIPSISTDFLREYEPPEAIGMFGEAGFPCIEFGFGHEADYLEGSEDEDARIERIRQAASDAGVSILQMHGHMFNLCGEDAGSNIERAHRSLRRGAALGARWVVLHPGTAEGMGSDLESFRWTQKRNIEVFQGFVETAEIAGTGVAVENVPDKRGVGTRFGDSIFDLIWLLEQVPSEYFGICWDTGHGVISGIDQGKALRTLGSRVVALHIDDNDGKVDWHWAPFRTHDDRDGKIDLHWTPHRGEMNWSDVVEALRTVGYAGPFNLEVPGEAAIPTAVKPAKLRFLAELARFMLA